jgi:hypothetical protein
LSRAGFYSLVWDLLVRNLTEYIPKDTELKMVNLEKVNLPKSQLT